MICTGMSICISIKLIIWHGDIYFTSWISYLIYSLGGSVFWVKFFSAIFGALTNVDRITFLTSQLLYYAGALFIISALYALLFYKPFEKYKSFFWVIVFTLIVFIYYRAKAYCAMGLYPVFIAFGSVFLGNILKTGWKKSLQVVLIIIPILFFIGMYNFAFPNKSSEYIINHPQKYTLKGYEPYMVDYLLKPVILERFAKAVDKAYHLLEKESEKNTGEYIFIKSDKQLKKIFLEDILF